MPITGEHYRHYKSSGGSDYTYEVLGMAKHSETGELLVVYKPLYVSTDRRLGDAAFVVRLLSMREEEVNYNGNLVKRFTKIG